MDLKLKKQFRGETNLDVFVWDENNNVAFTKAQDLKDSIVEVKKQVSRDSRTKDMEIQKATTLLILDELRKINKDTIN